ncbi:sodium-coupled monocarboxylate transporter 2-like [Zophobas morio]|uniref:sodium-coupled monocarboxylate transporter 2-like n=1 Tax=Zophobas morio TaxID=2755281 RepID=UPI0030828BA0
MTLKTSSTLGIYDYIIFISTLVFSTLIGIYYGCFGTKQATTKEYLMGGKNMKIIPIAVSVAISHISGSLLIATVSEVYRYGASMWLFIVSYVIMGLLAIFIYLPVFFKVQMTNIYEYLEKRFDKRTRIMAFAIYLLSEIIMFPIMAYAPSLTFAIASGMNPSWSAFVLCLICVFYTSIGGFKTVVWTDFLQFGVIMISLVTLYVIGLNVSGGFSTVWNRALEGERLQVFNFNVDFTARDSFWGYVACGPTVVAVVIVHQTGVQKFLSLPKYRDCVWSVIHTVFSIALIHTFCVFIGLVVYSQYKDCDPLTSHMVSKHDQLFPYFVADIGRRFPGVSGLSLAALCSAALSSMSSNLNALSGVIYKDVVCRFLKEQPSEKKGSDILKIIVLVVGFLCTCLVFLVERIGGVFNISLSVVELTQGPLLGVFSLRILFPKANHKVYHFQCFKKYIIF